MGIVHSHYNRTHHGPSCAAASFRCILEHSAGRIKYLESRRCEVQMMTSNGNSANNYLVRPRAMVNDIDLKPNHLQQRKTRGTKFSTRGHKEDVV